MTPTRRCPVTIPTPTRLLAIGAAAIAVGVLAVPAQAHAPVKARTPGPGKTATTVKKVSLRFGEAVITGKLTVTRNGRVVATKRSGLNAEKTVLSATLRKKLASGSYKVDWRARSDDGDSMGGGWTFRVR
jgi:methionine-rich copper-binding protein CopC